MIKKKKNPKEYLWRWLSGLEHLLLLWETWVYFSAPTCWLTPVFNSSNKLSDASSHFHSHYRDVMQGIHIGIILIQNIKNELIYENQTKHMEYMVSW